jgi:hypothetical protein
MAMESGHDARTFGKQRTDSRLGGVSAIEDNHEPGVRAECPEGGHDEPAKLQGKFVFRAKSPASRSFIASMSTLHAYKCDNSGKAMTPKSGCERTSAR